MVYDSIDPEKIPVEKPWIFESIILTEEEIIDFAKNFDPLPFHIDKTAAQQSRFGRLIASGPHIFIKAHKELIIPKLGSTIIAGLSIDQWQFLKPVYPDTPYTLHFLAQKLKPNREKKHIVITWQYEFFNPDHEMVQKLFVTSLHNFS